MSQELRDIWRKFDELERSAETPDTKALIAAIRLQTELLNLRMATLDATLASIAWARQ